MRFIKFAVVFGFGLLGAASCANNGTEPTDGGTTDAAATDSGPCGPGTAIKCGDTCVDIQANSQNCGACGKACPDSQVCSHGVCAGVCAGGTIHCGDNCVDVGVDVTNCGQCGHKCDSGQVCSKGTCALSCQDGLTNCNGDCVDVTQSDDNCGTCGAPCAGGQVCQNSKCVATCQSPWTSCGVGDAGATTCVDTQHDPQNCGGCNTTCPSGQFCSPVNGVGTCGLQCFGGTSLCSGACVDESIDKNHCGSCTTVCSGVCSAGHCCSSGQIYCGQCDSPANCITKSFGRIAAGNAHTCAITSSGQVKCWGDDSLGALGDNNPNTSSPIPVIVNTLTNVTDVGTGYGFTFAITGGAAYSWGDPYHGELGDGDAITEIDQPGSALVFVGATTPKQIEGGYQQGCAVMTNGSVQCWGYNEYGEVGDGTDTEQDSPVSVTLATTASVVDTGIGQFVCALLTNNTVECWGNDSYGQCGDNTSVFDHVSSPTPVIGLSGAIAISLGDSHACAIKSGGTVWCWGNDDYAQLGDGGNIDGYAVTPVQAQGVSGAVAIAAGGSHTCALLSTGAVVCWGANFSGQLGDGTGIDQTTPVTALSSGATALTAGSSHTCALKSDGTAWCWGYNGDGELGDGSGTDQYSPVQVSGF